MDTLFGTIPVLATPRTAGGRFGSFEGTSSPAQAPRSAGPPLSAPTPLGLLTGADLGDDRVVHRLRADFNGLFGGILCLSHEDACADEAGGLVQLRPGMLVTAFDEDANERGERDDLVASGVVEPAPEWLQCRGSKWILRIDQDGVHCELELRGNT